MNIWDSEPDNVKFFSHRQSRGSRLPPIRSIFNGLYPLPRRKFCLGLEVAYAPSIKFRVSHLYAFLSYETL